MNAAANRLAVMTASETRTVTPICGQWKVPLMASRTAIVTFTTGMHASPSVNWMPGTCRNMIGSMMSR